MIVATVGKQNDKPMEYIAHLNAKILYIYFLPPNYKRMLHINLNGDIFHSVKISFELRPKILYSDALVTEVAWSPFI